MTPNEKKELELSIPEGVSLPAGFEDRERARFPESLIVLAKYKRLIVYFTFSVAVVTAIITLFLPKSYTANARIVPPQQNQSIAAAMLGQLGSFAPFLS